MVEVFLPFFFYSVYVHRGKYMVIEKKAKEREDEPRIYTNVYPI